MNTGPHIPPPAVEREALDEYTELLVGDCRAAMRSLPAESVHCIVVSIPYFGLRAYGTAPQLWGVTDPDCIHEWAPASRPRQRGGGPESLSSKQRSNRGSAEIVTAQRPESKPLSIQAGGSVAINPAPEDATRGRIKGNGEAGPLFVDVGLKAEAAQQGAQAQSEGWTPCRDGCPPDLVNAPIPIKDPPQPVVDVVVGDGGNAYSSTLAGMDASSGEDLGEFATPNRPAVDGGPSACGLLADRAVRGYEIPNELSEALVQADEANAAVVHHVSVGHHQSEKVGEVGAPTLQPVELNSVTSKAILDQPAFAAPLGADRVKSLPALPQGAGNGGATHGAMDGLLGGMETLLTCPGAGAAFRGIALPDADNLAAHGADEISPAAAGGELILTTAGADLAGASIVSRDGEASAANCADSINDQAGLFPLPLGFTGTRTEAPPGGLGGIDSELLPAGLAGQSNGGLEEAPALGGAGLSASRLAGGRGEVPSADCTANNDGHTPMVCKKCGSVKCEWGSEPTIQQFTANTVEVFGEAWRVLRKDGTCFLNIGDSWVTAPGSGRGVPERASLANGGGEPHRSGMDKTGAGPRPLNLCLIPERLAIALQDAGWTVRSRIIRANRNPMPESIQWVRWERCRVKVKPTRRAEPDSYHAQAYGDRPQAAREGKEFADQSGVWEPCAGCKKCEANGGYVLRRGSGRPAKAHEHIWMLTKGGGNYWDAEAVREAASGNAHSRGSGLNPKRAGANSRETRSNPSFQGNDSVTGRHMRDVWTMTSQSYQGAHFATFPERLPELCIKASTSEKGCCPSCGAPWARVIELGEPNRAQQQACGGDASGEYHGQAVKEYAGTGAEDASAVKARILAGMRERKTTGWRPTCRCAPAEPVPATVLDFCGGSGTTAVAARRLRRHSILVELKREYCGLLRERVLAEPWGGKAVRIKRVRPVKPKAPQTVLDFGKDE